MPIVHYDNETGLSLFVQFDDSANTKIVLTEGIGEKARRYVASDDDLIDAGLAAGRWNFSIRLGDPDAITGTEMIRGAGTLLWDGEQEQDAKVIIDSGGGTLRAQVGQVLINQQDFLEIVQGEQKRLTFIVEGRFVSETFTALNVKIADVNGEVIEKTDSDITRVCEALDVQVLRCTLSGDDTDGLAAGLAKIEIAFDTQKARLVQAIKILEKIAEAAS